MKILTAKIDFIHKSVHYGKKLRIKCDIKSLNVISFAS